MITKCLELLFLSALALLFMTCNDDAVNGSHNSTSEEWTFPRISGYKGIRLVTEKDTVRVGEATTLKCVVYEIDSLYGIAIDLHCNSNRLSLSPVKVNNILRSDSVLIYTKVHSEGGVLTISYAQTLTTRKHIVGSSSGVLFKVIITPDNAALYNNMEFAIVKGGASIINQNGENMNWYTVEHRTSIFVVP